MKHGDSNSDALICFVLSIYILNLLQVISISQNHFTISKKKYWPSGFGAQFV